MRTRFGTGQRLFIAFALLVSTFALASYLTVAHVRSIHDGLLQTKHYEDGVRTSLELSSAVRDQYAHQAHTIILGNDTHLMLYAGARRHLTDTIEQVRKFATLPDERAWVDEIATASDRLDHVFRDRIVPAVLKRDSADVQEEHAHAQLLVSLIQDRSDRLVDRFEASISEFQADVSAMQIEAMRWTIFFVIGAPLLAVLVGLYVHRSIAQPVGRLQAGAARIAKGELDARIQIDTPDEFGALARQFNSMTQALKEHQEQLVQHEKLAGIGRLAAGVAHEINNPLAVILGYARLLGRRATGETAADLQIIEDESLRAKAIVDGLLDLARPAQIERDRVDLRAMVDEVVERLADAKVLENVSVSVRGAGSVVGSAQKLRQVALNLIKNGAEAAGPGGRVEVEITCDGRLASVIVRDTGGGLSREALERVFEPFFTSKAQGTGLGLAVSKGIAQAHGGTIEASNLPSGGARFEVHLPTAAWPAGSVTGKVVAEEVA
jgi:two-component system, NtrC family, sensor kinase